MIKSNVDQLVESAVAGRIGHPRAEAHDLRPAADGHSGVPVRGSGITFNVRVGDPAGGWAGGDHVEPGVALRADDPRENAALAALACIGNDAVITDAVFEGKDLKLKGVAGVVTGKHCGGDRVFVSFPKRVVDRLCVGDRIQVRAAGVGLRFLDYPDLTVFNMGPRLLRALNPSEKGGKVRVPVAKVIPGKLAGAGLGAYPQSGGCDIQTSSAEVLKEFTLDQVRLGDLVAITDHDATHGHRWQPGAITIGVISHGTSRFAGHGLGVNAILTSPRGTLEPIFTRKANLAEFLGLA
ncbi:MAG TPA: DUF4438 domain-containing protein [Planctomycetota bacterium]|nr:DUF4438 domain-containing protein [Planctomycetota bacterium]